LAWDPSTAGHVDAGESPDEAAVRELEEELTATELELKFLTKYRYIETLGGKWHKCFWYLYSVCYDGDVQVDMDEAVAGRFVALQDLEREINETPDNYTDRMKKSFEIFTTL